MNKLHNGWTEYKLKDLCVINYGKGLGKSNIVNGNIPVYSSGGIIGFHNTYNVNSEGVIIGRKGNAGSVFYSDKPFFCIDTAFYIEPNNQYDLKYLFYKLVSMNLKNHKTGTAIPGLIRNDIYKLSISIPPLDEQKRIASALSKIDAYLENTIKLIEEKERFKRGIAKKLLTCKEGENIPEARFKGFEDEWMEVAISKIGTIITGNTPSTKNESFWNGNNIWVTPTDIKQKYISNSERKLTDDGLKKSRKLPANTLLITCIASIGKNAILKCEGACNQQINAIIPNKNYNVDFLYYLFENEKSYLKFKAPQSVIKIMSKSEFSKLVFKFPLLEEQEKIGEYLSLLDKEIDNLKKQKELIKEMKRGAMQKLLSGEVRLLE
ncbi:restriction endonuclease subunit S [Brachyspira aalborgi]|uniref:Restriction endonuclease subunit S n=1 Tax=Brachyspira aalborgi TaxID=29522 RepID=A0A5C8CHI4_9SPIR|nr:restriction endonuclease subunit S [Brachyspira aalborgi]TXJ12770.1 restriction endonuclease subunit S [Brachyspira aalborgi]